MRATATLRYDFEASAWEAVADWNTTLTNHGATPELALWNLKKQANKHGLWPNGAYSVSGED